MNFSVIRKFADKLKKRPLLLFGIIHAILLLAVSANLDYVVGNCGVERRLAVELLDGNLPYSDVFTEYPPLAVLFFVFPGCFCHLQPCYSLLFALQIFLLDLLVLYLLGKFARRLNLSIWKVYTVATVSLVAIGLMMTGRYDLLPAALVLLAIYTFVNGHNKTAWAILGLGMMAKLYPAIIVPLFAIYLLRYRQYRKIIEGGLSFLTVVLVFSLPWLILDAGGYWEMWSYHLERGLHIESSYGSWMLVGQLLGWTHTTGQLSYGSWNLSSPLADSLAGASTYITFVLLLAAYALYAYRLWLQTDDREPAQMSGGQVALLLRSALLVVVVMLLTGKVFSVQFIIWLYPLLLLVITRWCYLPAMLFVLVAAITQVIYPWNYLDLELVKPYAVILMALRNLLLVALAVVLALPLRSPPVAEEKALP